MGQDVVSLKPGAATGVVAAAVVVNLALGALLYQLIQPSRVEQTQLEVSRFVEFLHLLPTPPKTRALLEMPPPLPRQPVAPALPAAGASAGPRPGAGANDAVNSVLPVPPVTLPSDHAAAEVLRAIALDGPLPGNAPAASGAPGVGTGSASGGGTGGGGEKILLQAVGIETNLVPSYRSSPNYPLRALRERIEGRVTVEFTITPDGAVRDPVIVQADPPGLFDAAVLEALPKWKFSPKLSGGKPAARRARQDVLFRLRQQ